MEVHVDVQNSQDKNDASEQDEGNATDSEAESQSDNALVVPLAATAGVLVILVAIVLRAHRVHDMQEGGVSSSGGSGAGMQRSDNFPDIINPMRASAEGGGGGNTR